MTTRARLAAAALLATLPMIAATGPAPAWAEPNSHPGANALSRAPLAGSSDPADPPTLAAPRRLGTGTTSTDPIVTDRTTRPVAPGLQLSSFDWLDQRGWTHGTTLTADLANPGLHSDLIFPGKVAKVAPVRAMADQRRAVAAVNGDFFDINNTGAPLGGSATGKTVLTGPVPEWTNGISVDAGGLGRLTELLLSGQVLVPGRDPLQLAGFNTHHLATGTLGAFTPLWGEQPRGRAVQGSGQVAEAVVSGGKVTAVHEGSSGEIPADGFVLLGREAGAAALRSLTVGDPVDLRYQLRGLGDEAPGFAVGGRSVLVRGGVVQQVDDVALHPRTAVGFSSDRKRMFLAQVDGRQALSRGMTLRELAEHLRSLGATDALELDGGGSATLVARRPGEAVTTVENHPSDGREREVANSVGLFAAAGSGRARGFWVQPAGGSRVFPGLTRRLGARAHDENYGPASAQPEWRVTPAGVGTVRDGVFRARRSGTAKVVAARGRASGQAELTVLGPLTRLVPQRTKLSLANKGSVDRLTFVGYDAEGYSAQLDAADLALEYDRSVVELAPAADGTLTVTPRTEFGSTVVTATAQGHRAQAGISVGVQEKVVATFDDADRWKLRIDRGTGKLTPVPQGRTGAGLKMEYDFSQSTAIRAASAIAPEPIPLPGQPLAIGAWVYGHGKGEWTAFTVTDGSNRTFSIYGPYVTWTGWRYVEVPISTDLTLPLRFNRFYTIETGASRQYTGEVLVDDLTVKVAPEVAVAPPTQVRDKVVLTDGVIDGKRWRFAVMSDAQFIAARPDPFIIAQTRRTLREIVAAKPDFMIIDGDMVDTGYPADFELAKKILDEEITGKIPWYYAPGNHEAYGTGNLDAFKAVFGPTHQTFDHKGTRFVLLDSSLGNLRSGGIDQVRMLEKALATARTDRKVNSVAVFWHHPVRDPSPRDDGLDDPLEMALVEKWLGEFHTETGKGATGVFAHLGYFHASRVDGVPYLVNGNTGKNPTGNAADGGWTGWTMFGVDPTPARSRPADRPWLVAQTRPHTDSVDLTVPAGVVVGQSATVRGTVVQATGGNATRSIPIAWPMAADWTGSPNVWIGPAAGRPAKLPARYVAAFDPGTGQLTGLRPGQAVLGVTVAEVHVESRFTVTG